MKDLHERFLNQYFLFTAATGKFTSVEQEEQVFHSLAKAYLIDNKSAEALWNIAQNGEVKQIEDEKDYLRYCRTRQYMKEFLQTPTEDGLESQTVAIKGGALSQALELNMIDPNQESKEKIISNLVYRAGEGCISALKALGIMQIHGICVDKDEVAGLKNLARAARWNDVDGAMLYLYYGATDRQDCFDSILTSLGMRYNSSLIRALKAAYPQEAKLFKRNDVACLIEKAFNASVLPREEYSASKARILYSQILPYQDKELAIYSMEDKQRRSPICDLPLKFDANQSIEIDAKAFNTLILDRRQERERILREAQNFDLRRMSNYTPLCLCADSAVLLQYYVSAIVNLAPNANVEVIEVGDLGKNDVDATANNIFVRKCDEDRPNVYIVSFRGEIAPEAMDLALDFLKSSRRKAFRLTLPSAQIDLSGILPICVCDKANESVLKKLCNTVSLASVSQEEKGLIIDDMLVRKAQLYGIEEISIDKDVKESIAKLSVDNIAKALDKAILANRIKAGKLILDEAMLGNILDEFKTINKYGFGGSIQ
ncbi:MAG: hypothetical protein K2L70_05615 [Clostridia bacterium]|nr:hypothetical protein [Clostridia bacterium]